MGTVTPQMQEWMGAFGQAYTDRNPQTPDDVDTLYVRNYGVTRTTLNERFLAGVSRTARVLEVGCNVGTQLALLRRMGFAHLHGIEIQPYAVERARAVVPGAEIVCASAFEIPFPDGHFDLVYTAGVLIHIALEDLGRALAEIHRCSREYIWGFEYWAEELTEVPYHGKGSLLWKADYARQYVERFPDLEVVNEERFRYLNNENIDTMFLLRKR